MSQTIYMINVGIIRLTKVHVPRRTITTNFERSGVLSGNGSQASSGTDGSVDVA